MGTGDHNKDPAAQLFIFRGQMGQKHYDVKSQSFNPGLQYPHLHGPVHTPDNNRWDTPPV